MISKTIKTVKIKDLLDNDVYNTNVDIQRDYIYRNGDLSVKVIDSIMNNINIATITCWDNEDGTYDVIDGKQRLTSIRQFYDNQFSWNGIQRSSFIEEQYDLFMNSEVCIAIQKGSFEDKVKCYIQINNGMELTDFEKLYALFHGEYLKGMKNFSDDENLCKCLGPYKRGNNCMLIMNLLRGNKSFHDFLYEKRNKSFNEELVRLNPLFETTVDIFEEYDQDMPILTYIVSRYWNKRNEWKRNKTKICKMLDSHWRNKDKKYANVSLYVYYTQLLNVWNKTDLDPRRFFTPEQKIDLFRLKKFGKGTPKDLTIDEYEADHIKEWASGGKTEIKNGQLLTYEQHKKKTIEYLKKNKIIVRE